MQLTYQQILIFEEFKKAEALEETNFDNDWNRTTDITFSDIKDMAEKFMERMVGYVNPENLIRHDKDLLQKTQYLYQIMLRFTSSDVTENIVFLPDQRVDDLNRYARDKLGVKFDVFRVETEFIEMKITQIFEKGNLGEKFADLIYTDIPDSRDIVWPCVRSKYFSPDVSN